MFNSSLCRRRWENWPDIKILVSGTPPEIVRTRLSKTDFVIRRAHKSALEGRHVRAQILKRSDCQLLEHFLCAHVFVLKIIPSRQIAKHFGTGYQQPSGPVHLAMLTGSQVSLGHRTGCGLRAREACPPFFASRAAVPHPASAVSRVRRNIGILMSAAAGVAHNNDS